MDDETQIIVIPNNGMAPVDAEPLAKRINAMRTVNKMLPRFIVALSISKSPREACKRIRMHPNWFSTLPDDVKQKTIDLADEMFADPIFQAREIIGNGVMEAAAKKMELVNSVDEKIADRASTYVLDQVLGKAPSNAHKSVQVEIVSNLPWGKSESR